MPSRLKLNDRVTIKFKSSHVTGDLVGIDTYELQNFSGGTCRWLSYTLNDGKGRLFKRYWLVKWSDGPWILWTASTRKRAPRGSRVIEDKSGLAQLTFAGDRGSSTPIAALTQYKSPSGYFCLERFLGSDVMIFDGHLIDPPYAE